MTIACIIPTRGRPKGLVRTVDSIRGQAVAYIGLDRTDPHFPAYATNLGKTFVFGDDPTTLKWNIMAAQAIEDGHDTLVLASDDVVFETPGWGTKLEALMTRHLDGIFCVGFNDGCEIGATPHYAVRREWVRALGHFCPPIFHHWGVDSWTTDVARVIGRYHYAVDIMARHLTVKLSGRFDETHDRIRVDKCWWGRDMNMLTTLGRYREADATALRSVMRG